MAKVIPQIGNWYQDVEEDVLFEVVALDEQEGCIEIQYLNGDIGEFDLETWQQMIVLSAQPPEDWSAPFGISDDNAVKDGPEFSVANWDAPQAELDPDL